MRYRILHTTEYDYAEPASTCHNQVHLTPRELPYQHRLSSDVEVAPQPHAMREHIDSFGNTVTTFAIYEPHRCLTITARSEVEVDGSGVGGAAVPTLWSSPPWEVVRDQLRSSHDGAVLDAVPFLFASPYVTTCQRIAAFAADSFPPGRPLLDAAQALTARIKRDFKYQPLSTTLATSSLDVLTSRVGVCQDFAHLQVACLRSLGLAARYVSGYLRTDPPPGKPRLVGADASHAWVSVFCPVTGWQDFDPTNGCARGDQHITLAWGRDYGDVSPVKGVVLGGGENKLRVSVDVEPVDE